MNKPYIHGMLPDVSAAPAPEASASEIRFIGDMQRLQPRPGDVFVLTCEQRIDRATAERIKAALSGQLGGAGVLVLDGGLKLEVVAVPHIAVDLASGPDESGMSALECGGLSVSMEPPRLSPESVAALTKDLNSFAGGDAERIHSGGYVATTQQVQDAARISQVHARARGDVVVQNFTVGDVATKKMVMDAIRRDQRYGGPV